MFHGNVLLIFPMTNKGYCCATRDPSCKYNVYISISFDCRNYCIIRDFAILNKNQCLIKIEFTFHIAKKMYMKKMTWYLLSLS